LYYSRNKSDAFAVDLAVTAPLWRLNEKILGKNANTTGVVSSLSRALMELFLAVEYIAMVRVILGNLSYFNISLWYEFFR